MAEIQIPINPRWIDDVVIRHITEADLVGLEWEGEFAHFRRLYQEAYRRAQRGLSVLWLAELTGQGLLGQVFIQLQCDRPELCNGIDRAYLYGFRVRAAFRGLGLGSRVMQVVERDLIKRGFRILTLNVAQENTAAIRLYERRGFYTVAPEPGRWQYIDEKGQLQSVNEPAWRMEKLLDPA